MLCTGSRLLAKENPHISAGVPTKNKPSCMTHISTMHIQIYDVYFIVITFTPTCDVGYTTFI
jgi:hypothetical protein